MKRYEKVWKGMKRYEKVWKGMDRPPSEKVWKGMDIHELIRHARVQSEKVWKGIWKLWIAGEGMLRPAVGCHSLLLAAVAWRWLLLAAAGWCWLLLAAAGCVGCWRRPPLANGCCQLLLAAAGCFWLLVAAVDCCWSHWRGAVWSALGRTTAAEYKELTPVALYDYSRWIPSAKEPPSTIVPATNQTQRKQKKRKIAIHDKGPKTRPL
jgi:hypothetical protein